jgi:general secretion pathway protein C
MTPIKSNVITIIIAIVCIIGLTSWYLIAMKSDQAGSSIELTKNIQSVSEETSSDSGHELQTADRENTTIASTKPTAVISKLTLLAVVVANPAINSSAVIQFDSRSDNYAIGEIINGTDVLLDEVLVDSVIVTLEGKEYELTLKGGDSDTYQQSSNRFIKENVTPLTAKEIGNRPKQLDHIIVISAENNNYTVVPGINPALFRAAKFKAGDILKTINGKDVTDPEELEQANALIATAQTLEFVVLRGGQFVTLYLDIPSKNLSISND